MGRMLDRAIEAAGLGELAARALAGGGLGAEDMARVRQADVILCAALADAVRARHRGDTVQVHTRESAARADVLRLSIDVGRPAGPTGQQALLEVAYARLSKPATRAIAVDFEQIGLQLAQTALAFGADALCGDLGTRRTLPLLDGPVARRRELSGLIERAGRQPRFCAEIESVATGVRSEP